MSKNLPEKPVERDATYWILQFIGFSIGFGIGLMIFFPLIGLFGLSIFFTKEPKRRFG